MSPYPHSWMYQVYTFIILLFCQLFSWARSTWVGSQPWNTTMPFREDGHKWVLLQIFFIKEISWLQNWIKTVLNNNLWKGCVILCGCIRLRLFFHTQSSVCLHTRGTSERWSWQRKWTQDIIRERKDDNQVKLWVRCYQLKWHGVKCILSQLHYISQNGPTSLCWFCVRQSEHTLYFLLL